MANAGIILISFGVFFKPVSAQFGWTRAETAGAFSLATIITGLTAVLLGRLGDRFESRWIIVGCGFLEGLAYLLLSQMTSLWQLFVFYGLFAGVGLANVIPAASLVARSYRRRRGLMTGIAMSGTAASAIIAPTLATFLIGRFSWNLSYLIIGCLNIAIIALAAFFLF